MLHRFLFTDSFFMEEPLRTTLVAALPWVAGGPKQIQLKRIIPFKSACVPWAKAELANHVPHMKGNPTSSAGS